MLAARNITVRRGGCALLHKASLELHPGEVLAVIGPNGAGKSTLLRVLSGSLAPDTGTVSLDGRPLMADGPQALARRRAVLAQEPRLAFPFRAREVVALGRIPHAGRSSRAQDRAAVMRAMDQADIGSMADRIYPSLSGGEKQRVQLARALAQIDGDGSVPSYLLLDEPTNNLDLRHQQATLALARRRADSGDGVLAILHDPNLAAQFADRVVVLAGGRVVADGAPDAVLTPDLMAAIFGVVAESHARQAPPRAFLVTTGIAVPN